jgi:hypothetical protein
VTVTYGRCPACGGSGQMAGPGVVVVKLDPMMIAALLLHTEVIDESLPAPLVIATLSARNQLLRWQRAACPDDVSELEATP